MTGEQELVRLLKTGSADAFEQMITRCRAGAEAYASSLLHDSQAAEDAVQEAFSRLYAVRTDIDENRSFSAYLYTIVKRICIDELRKEKRFPELPVGGDPVHHRQHQGVLPHDRKDLLRHLR